MIWYIMNSYATIWKSIECIDGAWLDVCASAYGNGYRQDYNDNYDNYDDEVDNV